MIRKALGVLLAPMAIAIPGCSDDNSGKVPVSNKAFTKDDLSTVYVQLMGPEDALQEFAKDFRDYEPKPDFVNIFNITATQSSMHVNFPQGTSVAELKGFNSAAFERRILYYVTHPDFGEDYDPDGEEFGYTPGVE